MLKRMLERRGQIHAAAEAMVLDARSQGRSYLSEGEAQRLRHAHADLETLDERIEETRSELARIGQLPARLACVGTDPERPPPMRNESTVYRAHNGPSWIRDLCRVQTNRDESGESRQRLARHAEDVANFSGYEQRDLSRVDGSGGYAVPPAWLMNQYVDLARPGRAFANLCQRQPLPGGTDSINIPKLLTGTAVGIQTADNTTVTEVDLSDTFITAPVRTIAGQQSVAIQLIDQSPIAFDDVVFRDLVAAHAAVLDAQCLYGTGSSGQVLGVNQTPGIQTIPISAMTIQGIYSAIANSIQLILTTRYQPPEVVVMHPRRWAWLLSLLDQNNRPLFIPQAGGPWNAAGILTDVDSQQVVGQVAGLPIVTDPNISTTQGSTGGTSVGTDDVIYVMRASDLVLWESGIRARVLPEPKASTLGVILQVYSYVAFAASRYPQSVCCITGLSAPSF
jgi:HK97 family phage major capsid protein